MNRIAGYVVVLVLGLAIGYFAGREHLKYEMRSAIKSAAEEISEGFSSAFGGGGETSDVSSVINDRDTQQAESDTQQAEEDLAKTAYIKEHLELYDLSAKYIETYLEDKVAGVLFKLRNTGERSLDRVEVTVYFKDASGNVIAEEDFHPVLVSKYSSKDSKPLRPGYIWQMEKSKYYTAKQVPSEWKEGSVQALITDIRFSK